jgi:hypothetical protein
MTASDIHVEPVRRGHVGFPGHKTAFGGTEKAQK